MFEKVLASRHLRHLDLSGVREKVISKFEWNNEKAITTEIEYKRFLYAMIKKKAGEMISPQSQDVDEFWHQHILFTHKYRQDCELLFGHFIDHSPALPHDVQRKADERRAELWREFDIDDQFSDLLDDQLDAAEHPAVDHAASNDGGHSHGSAGGHGHGGHGDGGHGDGGHGGDGGSDGGGGGDGGGSGCGGGGCGG